MESLYQQHGQVAHVGARGAGDNQAVRLAQKVVSVVIGQRLGDGKPLFAAARGECFGNASYS